MPQRVSGPPPLMLPGAALGSLAARFCWQGHFRLWTVPQRVSGPPPLCCQTQHLEASRLVSAGRGTHTRHPHVDSLTHTRQTHTRSLTVPFAHGARASLTRQTHSRRTHVRLRCRFTLDTHLGASRLVSAGRGSTAALDGARARFGAPCP